MKKIIARIERKILRQRLHRKLLQRTGVGAFAETSEAFPETSETQESKAVQES